MADADVTASAAEPSAAEAWFQRKMALHETERQASAKARQAEAVAEQKRLERSEEATRRVDRELEWNRARVSALRARLETAIAPIRAARDARDPTARHKAPSKPVFVSYARDAPFAERALVRAIVDAVNSTRTRSAPTKTKSSSLCWHDDVLFRYRDWKHVQVRRVDAGAGRRERGDELASYGDRACTLKRAATASASRPVGGAAPRRRRRRRRPEACGFRAEAIPTQGAKTRNSASKAGSAIRTPRPTSSSPRRRTPSARSEKTKNSVDGRAPSKTSSLVASPPLLSRSFAR